VEFVKVDSDNPDNVNDTEEVRGAWLEGIDVGNTLGEGEGNAVGAIVGNGVGVWLGRVLGTGVGDNVMEATPISRTSLKLPV